MNDCPHSQGGWPRGTRHPCLSYTPSKNRNNSTYAAVGFDCAQGTVERKAMMHCERPLAGIWPPVALAGSPAAIEDARGCQLEPQRSLSWRATAQKLGWLALLSVILIIV